jgi:hypothetical protein
MAQRLQALVAQLKQVAPTSYTGVNGVVSSAQKELRAGIIGLDTSHSVAFVKVLNQECPGPEFVGCKVVAATPRGTGATTWPVKPTIQSSAERIPGYTKEVQAMGVEIYHTVAEMLEKVDVVFLETNDGWPRLEQALEVLRARKPMFIDKPVAATLSDTMLIYMVAKALHVPIFSASSLRWAEGCQAARQGAFGRVLGCDSYSPANLDPDAVAGGLPSLFWYGIHGVEMLYTAMGTGCETVSRTSTENTDVCVGQWSDGRLGTFRGMRDKSVYGGNAYGESEVGSLGGSPGYESLLAEILKFFRNGQPPVSDEETLELYGFMIAAEESKARGGEAVAIAEVMAAAKAKALAELDEKDHWFQPGTYGAYKENS